MKLELCWEEKPITIGYWGQPSAEVFSCLLALVLDVSVLSNTVLCNIITFYRLNQAK
jgi:hypothetical protein